MKQIVSYRESVVASLRNSGKSVYLFIVSMNDALRLKTAAGAHTHNNRRVRERGRSGVEWSGRSAAIGEEWDDMLYFWSTFHYFFLHELTDSFVMCYYTYVTPPSPSPSPQTPFSF